MSFDPNNKYDVMTNFVFEKLHKFTRLEQLELLEEELFNLISTFEEQEVHDLDSSVLKLFKAIKKIATYEYTEQVWSGIENKLSLKELKK